MSQNRRKGLFHHTRNINDDSFEQLNRGCSYQYVPHTILSLNKKNLRVAGMGLREFQKVILVLSLFASSLTMAEVQQHNFSISGDNGENGSGTFTWDDVTVPSGSVLDFPDILSISITVSGGNVIGGTTNFTKTDCTNGFAIDTPDFSSDINFWCDNRVNAIEGVEVYTNELNRGPSILTFTPGTLPPASTAIPTISTNGLVLTMLGLILVASRRLRSSIKPK
jgi:hypothetical protein